MTSPQLENGYTKIANEIMDVFAHFYMPGRHWQCLHCIVRNIYGWKDKYYVKISLSEISRRTGIARQHTVRIVGELEDHKIIKVGPQEGTNNRVVVLSNDSRSKVYEFNKDYNEWIEFDSKVSPRKGTKQVGPQEGTNFGPREGTNTPYIKKKKERLNFKFKKLMPLPNNFRLTSEMFEYAKKKNYHKDLEVLTEKFMAHHGSKGNKFKDWYRAWQKWLLQDIQWYGTGESKKEYFPD